MSNRDNSAIVPPPVEVEEISNFISVKSLFITPFSIPIFLTSIAGSILLGFFSYYDNSISTPSNILYFLYYISWVVRYYPQLIMNIKRRCTTGLSPNYVFCFLISAICNFLVSVSNLFILNSNGVKGDSRQVKFDSVYSLNCVFALSLMMVHMLTRGSWRNQVPSPFNLSILSMIVIIYAIFVGFLYLQPNDILFSEYFPLFLDALSYMSQLFSVVRFIPQLHFNRKNKVFFGFDLVSICLDFVGSIALILFVFFDGQSTLCSNCRYLFFSSIFLLVTTGCISILNIVLFIQFIVYKDNYTSFFDMSSPLLDPSIGNGDASTINDVEIARVERATEPSAPPAYRQNSVENLTNLGVSTWGCARCTYINSISASKCKMCDFRRPTSTQPR